MEITKVYGGRASIMFQSRGGKHFYTVTVPGICKNLFQPSVTTVLKMKDKSDALVNWAVKSMYERTKELIDTDPGNLIDKETILAYLDAAQETWREKRQDAADIGTVVHRVLYQTLLSRSGLGKAPVLPVTADPILAPHLTPELLELANNSISAGVQFIEEHDIEVIQAEAPRWSPTYGYIGMGDLIARIDGDRSALDWKTGKRLYSEVFLQLAAYSMAYHEEFPDEEPITHRVAVNVGRDGTLSHETRKSDEELDVDFKAFRALLAVYRWHCENQGKYSKPAPRVLGPLEAVAA